MATMRPARRGGLAAIVAVGLLAAACGNDSDGDDAAVADEAADTEEVDAADDVGSAGDGGADGVAATCDGFFTADAAFNDLEGIAEEDPDAAQAHVEAEILPPAQQFRDNAPDDIAAEADVLVGAVEELATTGAFEALESPEVAEANAVIDSYLFENCDGERVEVDLTNFAFVGAPDTLPAGERIMFRGANVEETEVHEMILVKRNPGTDEPVEELLALDEEQAFEKVTFTAAGFAPPGEGFLTTAVLEPGEYVMACFIPEGTTFEDLEAEGGEDGEGGEPEQAGTPHWEHGMVHELTVE